MPGKELKKWDELRDCRGQMPGPGQYTLPELIGCKNTDVTKWKSPCYKFGMQLPQILSKLKPGPADYTIGDVTRHGKVTSPIAPMLFRLPPRKSFIGPGPGNYSPENYLNSYLHRAPAYQIARRLDMKPSFITPGPNAYKLTGQCVTNKCPPSYSLVGKRPPIQPPKTPGPPDYGNPNIDLTRVRSPAYSLAPRRTPKPPAVTPGPGAYSPNANSVLRSSPAPSFTGRPNPCIKPYILPIDDEFA